MGFHDDRPVGWTNPNTGVTYSRVRQFRAAMDNYEPAPRRTSNGVLQVWLNADGTLHGYDLIGWGDERDAHQAVYLIDDGRSVGVFYVAGYSQERDRITLHPFPTGVDADGSPKMAPDGRPVDFASWLLGPRRAYHLKIIGG